MENTTHHLPRTAAVHGFTDARTFHGYTLDVDAANAALAARIEAATGRRIHIVDNDGDYNLLTRGNNFMGETELDVDIDAIRDSILDDGRFWL
jgi:hypothetical protein